MKKHIHTMRGKAIGAYAKTVALLKDKRGELATNTIGSIIIAVVIIGLLVLAINAFFPNFFGDMFDSMADKLNANW